MDVIFSTCMDDEFTCDDGTCINMTKRCDNINNCPNDISDEVECKLVIIPSSYEETYAPIKVGANDFGVKAKKKYGGTTSRICKFFYKCYSRL